MLADLVRYVDFGPADSQRLVALHRHAKGSLLAIADTFYARILASEEARVVLGDPERAVSLRRSLVEWMDALLAGPHNEALFESARRIGHKHVTVAAPPRYVLGGMACIRDGLTRVAASAMPDQLVEIAGSISKILDIESALIMEAYNEHWISRVQRKERAELNSVKARLQDVEWALEQSTETANMLVIGLDTAGRIVLFNSAASELTGLRSEDALGSDAFDLLFGEAASAVRQRVLAAERVPPFLELTVRTRDGRMHTCRFYVSRHTPWGSDRPTHLLTAVDWEQERREQRAGRRRDRVAAVQHLGSGFAHEVRNPLNGAMLNMRILDRALQQKGAPQDLLQIVIGVDGELQRIKRLTDDFIAFMNPVGLRSAAVALGPICQRVVERAAAKAAPGAVLRSHIPAEPLVVEGDEGRLEAALDHLVSNGLDALADGRGTVIVRAVRESAHAAIDVEDDGPGLSAPADVIFDAFFTTKAKGTGLGLAVVERTALDHGGSIDVTSAPGKTVFSLRIPLVSPLRSGAGASSGVVLIDQDIRSAKALASLLETDGYRVALDVDGKPGPAFLADPAIVVTDLTSARSDRASLVQAVNSRWPTRKIFYATTRPRLASTFTTPSGQGWTVFAKPVDYPLLRSEISGALRPLEASA
jgi:PAS domain S-box-containing protein